MTDSRKQILVMRHAKSSWSETGATDHQRTLNKRGLRDAPRMGQFISDQGCPPQLIAASSAMRARLTAELFAENCLKSGNITLDIVDDFYHASPIVYLEYIADLPDDEFDSVVVVGHNPGLEELVFHLSGHYERMPTAAIASFQVVSGRWSDVIQQDKVNFDTVWRPKEVL